MPILIPIEDLYFIVLAAKRPTVSNDDTIRVIDPPSGSLIYWFITLLKRSSGLYPVLFWHNS